MIIIMAANLLRGLLYFIIFIAMFWHSNFYISVFARKLMSQQLLLFAGLCPISFVMLDNIISPTVN